MSENKNNSSPQKPSREQAEEEDRKKQEEWERERARKKRDRDIEAGLVVSSGNIAANKLIIQKTLESFNKLTV